VPVVRAVRVARLAAVEWVMRILNL
jgi:hypothetical protein